MCGRRLLMRTLFLILSALLLTPAHAGAADLTPLSEAELADVSGQQGVLINLFLRNNVNASNAPMGCSAPASVPATPNPCRLGLEFAGAASTGKWLMLKEFYGTFQVKDLRMDATFLPASNTTYWNVDRFDSQGADLVAGCGATPLLPACNPKGLAAIKFSYPGVDAPGTYDDFLSYLNIGRVWLEADAAGPPVVPGYQRDTSLNSFIGVRMSDSRMVNEPAHTRFVGDGYVYGF